MVWQGHGKVLHAILPDTILCFVFCVLCFVMIFFASVALAEQKKLPVTVTVDGKKQAAELRFSEMLVNGRPLVYLVSGPKGAQFHKRMEIPPAEIELLASWATAPNDIWVSAEVYDDGGRKNSRVREIAISLNGKKLVCRSYPGSL